MKKNFFWLMVMTCVPSLSGYALWDYPGHGYNQVYGGYSTHNQGHGGYGAYNQSHTPFLGQNIFSNPMNQAWFDKEWNNLGWPTKLNYYMQQAAQLVQILSAAKQLYHELFPKQQLAKNLPPSLNLTNQFDPKKTQSQTNNIKLIDADPHKPIHSLDTGGHKSLASPTAPVPISTEEDTLLLDDSLHKNRDLENFIESQADSSKPEQNWQNQMKKEIAQEAS